MTLQTHSCPIMASSSLLRLTFPAHLWDTEDRERGYNSVGPAYQWSHQAIQFHHIHLAPSLYWKAPQNWDVYTDLLTFENSTQIHSITKCTLFEPVLSQPPKVIIIEPDPDSISTKTCGSYFHRWNACLSHLEDIGSAHILRAKKEFQRWFNANISPSSFNFCHSHSFAANTHKLAKPHPIINSSLAHLMR